MEKIIHLIIYIVLQEYSINILDSLEMENYKWEGR